MNDSIKIFFFHEDSFLSNRKDIGDKKHFGCSKFTKHQMVTTSIFHRETKYTTSVSLESNTVCVLGQETRGLDWVVGTLRLSLTSVSNSLGGVH